MSNLEQHNNYKTFHPPQHDKLDLGSNQLEARQRGSKIFPPTRKLKLFSCFEFFKKKIPIDLSSFGRFGLKVIASNSLKLRIQSFRRQNYCCIKESFCFLAVANSIKLKLKL